MKKLMLYISPLLLMFVLIGCSTKNLPTITLEPSEVSINLYDTYDFMEGVTANDTEDGDITDSVTVDLGDFDSNKIGQYTITYSVTNSKGKSISVNRNVNVTYLDPIFTNHDELVVDFNNLQVTSGELYNMLKSNVGLSLLMERIDKEVLKDYADLVDIDAINEKIASDKAKNGEETFYNNLEQIGIFQQEGETTEAFENRVIDFYRLGFQEKLAAKDHAINALTTEDKQALIDNYREDICVINLTYSTRGNASDAIEAFNALDDSEVLAAFVERWSGEPTESNDTYLDNIFTCDYERVRYTGNGTYQAFVFDELTEGTYNTDPKFIGTKYYVTYKVSVAPSKDTYDETQFLDELVERYADKLITQAYIKEMMASLRSEANIEIYDPKLAAQYKSVDQEFKVTEIDDHTLVAKIDGLTITAEDLYNDLKKGFTIQALLNKINYEVLKTVEGIQLTDSEFTEYDKQVSQIRLQYQQGGYSQVVTFKDYIKYFYGVFSEDQLKELFATQDLIRRYILGHEVDGQVKYEGVEPVLDSEITEMYDKWFEVKASHILFEFDDEASKQIAYTKAMQVIRGVEDGEEAYIKLDGLNFEGLNNTYAEDYGTVFNQLAKNYSSDPSAISNGGDLGYFSNGRMVTEFEDAVIEMTKSVGEGGYSLQPVLTEFGYHIIYLTDVKEKPIKPANYDSFTEEEILRIIQISSPNDEIKAIDAYYKFIKGIEGKLIDERMQPNNTHKWLADLRDDLNFSFNDEDIQAHYEAIQETLLQQ